MTEYELRYRSALHKVNIQVFGQTEVECNITLLAMLDRHRKHDECHLEMYRWDDDVNKELAWSRRLPQGLLKPVSESV